MIIFICMFAAESQGAVDDLSLLKAAQRGDVPSMRKIGMRMHQRVCFRGDPETGIQWLKKAADKGDVGAMYYLGRVYLPKNKELGESYMKKAAEHGNSKAKKYFEKVVTKKKEAYEDRVGAVRLDKAIADAVTTMQERIEEAGVKEIAMVEFLCNGGPQNELTDAVRGKIQQAILEGSDVQISDRVDVKMLAEESGAQGGDLGIKATTAVFMGEIICQPGGDVGYFIYRMFHTKDMRIVAADFVPVKWTSFEKELLKKIPLKVAPSTLPFTPKRDLDEMVEQVNLKKYGGIAMVHRVDDPDNDTIEYRVAFAQVLGSLFEGGLTLYEREFLAKGVEEASLSGQDVQLDGVGTLCAVKLVENQKKNGLEVRLTSYPEGGLRFVRTLTQARGSIIAGASSAKPTIAVLTFENQTGKAAVSRVKSRYPERLRLDSWDRKNKRRPSEGVLSFGSRLPNMAASSATSGKLLGGNVFPPEDSGVYEEGQRPLEVGAPSEMQLPDMVEDGTTNENYPVEVEDAGGYDGRRNCPAMQPLSGKPLPATAADIATSAAIAALTNSGRVRVKRLSPSAEAQIKKIKQGGGGGKLSRVGSDVDYVLEGSINSYNVKDENSVAYGVRRRKRTVTVGMSMTLTKVSNSEIVDSKEMSERVARNIPQGVEPRGSDDDGDWEELLRNAIGSAVPKFIDSAEIDSYSSATGSSPAPMISFEVKSVPTGAEVEYNHSYVGKTPCTVTAPAVPGILRVTRVGWEPWERRVTPTTDGILVELQRSRKGKSSQSR